MSSRRWLQILLIASLSVNLLIVGGLMGRLMDRRPPLDWAVQPLDAEIRAKIRPVLREKLTQTRPLRRELKRARSDFERLLGEETLNIDQAEATLSRLREVTSRYQREVHNAALVVLRDLPPEDRRALARQLLAPTEGVRRPPRH